MIYKRIKGSRQIGNYLAGLSRQIAFPYFLSYLFTLSLLTLDSSLNFLPFFSQFQGQKKSFNVNTLYLIHHTLGFTFILYTVNSTIGQP